ncbi:MAG: 3-phosphoshikimate 1-carboxyvinyltransferase [Armatimonadetes bacterium]|nr:3-phosphoshikimate 1-carboxyvinyltransferase [Armatimonadota bacterium]
MRLRIRKSRLSGSVEIPGSKSHTIRAVAIASLAEGTSRIRKPLVAADTLAAVNAYRLLGAGIDCHDDEWTVRGVAGKPRVPDNVIDVGNSGTTLYIALGTAALVDGTSVFTGDEQIRSRPAGPLIRALNDLGAKVESTRCNDKAPILVRGPIRGGNIALDGSKTSQYLTSLLINCPLAERTTSVEFENAIEKPYIEMTIAWLTEQGIKIERDGFRWFEVHGKQRYRAFDKPVPADFSSATFFMCAAAVTGSEITLTGLDPNDTQGDKAVVDILRAMGAEVEWVDLFYPYSQSPAHKLTGNAPSPPHEVEVGRGLRVKGRRLTGGEFDLADTPDALPALAVTACFAEGETRLVNVAQARLKETDRISVMRQELLKMGGDIEELPDGLVIRGRSLRASDVDGHYDHRVIMALATAGLACEGEMRISAAEALSVTFPTFVELMQSVGAEISIEA